MKKKFDYKKSLKDIDTSGWNKARLFDLYITRPLSAIIVKIVFNTRITPNILTIISFIFGMIAALIYFLGNIKNVIIAGILAFFSIIFDTADGMLARGREESSRYGAYLDIFFDRIIDFSLIITITINVYKNTNNLNLLIIGLIAGGMYLLQINLFYLKKSYLNITKTGDTGEFRVILFLIILILSIINKLEFFIYFMIIETIIVCLIHFIHFIIIGIKENKLCSGPMEQNSNKSESSKN